MRTSEPTPTQSYAVTRPPRLTAKLLESTLLSSGPICRNGGPYDFWRATIASPSLPSCITGRYVRYS